MMPFIEIMFCGLATSIFPFSWYRGGRRRSGWGAWGTPGTPAGPPAQVPDCHRLCMLSLCHPQAFWGAPCAPKGLPGTLVPVAECSGYHRVQPCIIKLPWLFASETFTIPRSAGKDDCSKPKLGINYTTTLHFFFYKGKTVWQEPCRHLLPKIIPLQGLLWNASQRA